MSQTEMLGNEVARGQVLPEWIDINNHMNGLSLGDSLFDFRQP